MDQPQQQPVETPSPGKFWWKVVLSSDPAIIGQIIDANTIGEARSRLRTKCNRRRLPVGTKLTRIDRIEVIPSEPESPGHGVSC